MLPAVNALILNKLSWNIGSAILRSMTQNTASSSHPAAQQADHLGAGPAHGLAVIGLDAHRDPDQDRAQAQGEGDVAPPVHARGMPLPHLLEPQVGPHRAEHADGHVDPEDQAPVDGGQQAPGDQADELAGQRGDLVGAQRETALGGPATQVRIAAELAISMDPPAACRTRQPISQIAPAPPRYGSKESRIDAIVKTTKPAL